MLSTYIFAHAAMRPEKPSSGRCAASTRPRQPQPGSAATKQVSRSSAARPPSSYRGSARFAILYGRRKGLSQYQSKALLPATRKHQR